MNIKTNSHTLVLYYSLTGHTRSLATALAWQLGADLEEIRCPRYQRGPLGYSGCYLRAAMDGWKQQLPQIEPLVHAPADYGLVVIGGPVWAGHIAAPVRTLLQQEKGRLHTLAFFLTHGGSPAAPVFAEMQQLAGVAPASTVAVLQRQMTQGDYTAAADAFVAGLSVRLAA